MSNVQILKVGHSLVQGARGEKGGAPSKDSIWGLAQIGSALVKFSGRRGGKLRFKSTPMAQKDSALALFQAKTEGKGLAHRQYLKEGKIAHNYVDVTDSMATPEFTKAVASAYVKACTAGKLDKRSMAKKK